MRFIADGATRPTALRRSPAIGGAHLTGAGRPKLVRRVAPKQPDSEPSLFLFRSYEAAVRDLTHPATSGHPIGRRISASKTDFGAQPP